MGRSASVVAMSDAFDNFINVRIYQRGRIEVRRIDVLLVLLGILIAVYYGWSGGWLGALTGVFAYAFSVMVAMWFLPHR
jgi:glucose-6-phosphate-specific signal transduction histidine kinase